VLDALAHASAKAGAPFQEAVYSFLNEFVGLAASVCGNLADCGYPSSTSSASIASSRDVVGELALLRGEAERVLEGLLCHDRDFNALTGPHHVGTGPGAGRTRA
jgi:hypothetical protein